MKKSELTKLIKECHKELLNELLYTPSDKDEYIATMDQLNTLILKIRSNKLIQASAATKTSALNLATALNELDIKVKDEINKQK